VGGRAAPKRWVRAMEVTEETRGAAVSAAGAVLAGAGAAARLAPPPRRQSAHASAQIIFFCFMDILLSTDVRCPHCSTGEYKKVKRNT